MKHICEETARTYGAPVPHVAWNNSIQDATIQTDENTIELPNNRNTQHIAPHMAYFATYAYLHHKGFSIFPSATEQHLRIIKGVTGSDITPYHTIAYHKHAAFYNPYPEFTYTGLHYVTPSSQIHEKLKAYYRNTHNISHDKVMNMYKHIHEIIDQKPQQDS